MDNEELVQNPDESEQERTLISRRNFLAGLRKWSTAVIGVAVVGGVLLPEEVDAGWVNRGGSWINGGGGGVAWANRGIAWANRGIAWANRSGGGGSWVNRRGW